MTATRVAGAGCVAHVAGRVLALSHATDDVTALVVDGLGGPS